MVEEMVQKLLEVEPEEQRKARVDMRRKEDRESGEAN